MATDKHETAVAPAAAASVDTPIASSKDAPRPQFVLTEKSLDDAFNDIWANNANAISHCYSNTDALKVDFTRTGKRSFLGMINDATNSVYRMVQGAVTDFFRQTVLDFIYGSIGLNGLERYYDDLNSRDPSEAVRLVRVRASAIESCHREAIAGTEPLVGAWTVCSPLEADKIQSLKLEEKVALLTSKALYICSYDFGSEKLNHFTKILVGDIVSIKTGLYVTSPHESSHPNDNWGCVIEYLNAESRSNSTATIKNISTTKTAPKSNDGNAPTAKNSDTDASPPKVVAFRAISDEVEPEVGGAATVRSRHLDHTLTRQNQSQGNLGNDVQRSAASASRDLDNDNDDDDDLAGAIATSKQKVARITALLADTCADAGAYDSEDPDSIAAFITQGTIQSLDEAKAMMPLFGPLIEGLKRRLWL
ncbi:hypothetical protein BCV70DRAFT_201926 [Testicularia cyperi]|uniref:HSac2 domain-containing protein n=1 Tax=Testicularia cyperi TaxID=1882483 RepID=A0A317XL59_9BASI|nr:hypothetical protein BCV70DRAFT_201926 [Testicularia cyperi]